MLAGIITLEDVIEELIGEEIVDETDLYVDVHRRIAVARARLSYNRQSISEPAKTRKERKKIFRRSWSQPHMKPGGMDSLPVPGQNDKRGQGNQLATISELEVTFAHSHYVCWYVILSFSVCVYTQEPPLLSTSVPVEVHFQSTDDEEPTDQELDDRDTTPLIMRIN